MVHELDGARVVHNQDGGAAKRSGYPSEGAHRFHDAIPKRRGIDHALACQFDNSHCDDFPVLP